VIALGSIRRMAAVRSPATSFGGCKINERIAEKKSNGEQDGNDLQILHNPS